MANSSSKKKTETKKPLRKPASKQSAAKTSTEPIGAAHWELEIKQLLSRKFSSIEEAIDELALRVCNRLEVSDREREIQAKFLKDLLMTDPEMRAELMEVLNFSDS